MEQLEERSALLDHSMMVSSLCRTQTGGGDDGAPPAQPEEPVRESARSQMEIASRSPKGREEPKQSLFPNIRSKLKLLINKTIDLKI